VARKQQCAGKRGPESFLVEVRTGSEWTVEPGGGDKEGGAAERLGKAIVGNEKMSGGKRKWRSAATHRAGGGQRCSQARREKEPARRRCKRQKYEPRFCLGEKKERGRGRKEQPIKKRYANVLMGGGGSQDDI